MDDIELAIIIETLTEQLPRILTRVGFTLTSILLAGEDFEYTYRKDDYTVIVRKKRPLTDVEEAAMKKLTFVKGQGDILHIYPR